MLTNSFFHEELNFSIKECMCHPWNYPKPIDKDVPLCQYFGNDCFFTKFQDNTYKLQNCDCLPACNEVNYKLVIDSNRKFSNEEINKLCADGTLHFRYISQSENKYMDHLKLINITLYPPDHAERVCENYIRTQFARVQVKMDGSSYLRRIQTLKYKDSDKFAIIGGTLGLFTGFSFIVFFELLYWILVTVQKNMSNPEKEEDPVMKEISSLKDQVSELKEMISGVGKKPLNSGSILEIDASSMTNQLTTDDNDTNPAEVPSPSIQPSLRSSRRFSTFTVSSFNSMQLPKIE